MINRQRRGRLALIAVALMAIALVATPVALSPGADSTAIVIPKIELHVKPAALAQIRATRERALKETNRILITQDRDWVGATLILRTAATTERHKVRLRLKGDWADHFQKAAMPSLRIKVRDDLAVLGMRRFSLQAPVTRNFQYEPLLFDELRHAGVIAPRYQFVEVALNDRTLGVMALEEHFGVEMIEHAGRRAAPILGLDEDDLWAQRVRNRDRPGRFKRAGLNPNQTNLRYETYPVRWYSQVDPTSRTATAIAERGRGLLRGFMEGDLPAERVFDIETTARWLTRLNVFAGGHGVIPHNQRFYFNPILDRLEPIGFDNDAMRGAKKQGNMILSMDGRHLLAAPAFAEAVSQEAAAYRRDLATAEGRARLVAAFDAYAGLLGRDGDADAFVDLLRARVRHYQAQLAEAIPAARSTRRALGPASKRIADFLDHAPDIVRVAQVYAWRDADDQLVLETVNIGRAPIQLDGLRVERRFGTRRLPLDAEVAPYYRGGAFSQTLRLDAPDVGAGDRLWLDLSHDQEAYEVPVRWYGPAIADPDADLAALLETSVPGVTVDQANRRVTIAGERVRFDRSTRFPPGFGTEIVAGTTVELGDGVRLQFDGALDVTGTAEAPVTIAVGAPAPADHRWSGLLVRRSAARSTWAHFRVVGRGGSTLTERQDRGGITGCVTFYESDLVMRAGSFEDLACEDALNVIRGRFELDAVTMRRVAADAFDADFAEGTIRNAVFAATGNDGVDVSGSVVNLTASRFTEIGDKAVSVGERSAMTASAIEVDGAVLGVVAKDESELRIEASTFRNISDAVYAAYQKKPEFGPAVIHAADNQVTNALHLWALDERSVIELAAITE